MDGNGDTMFKNVDDLAKKLIKNLIDKGYDPEEVLSQNKIQLTDIPPDAVMSEVYRRISEDIAAPTDHDYICHICGEPHNDTTNDDGTTKTAVENLYDCIQNHIYDFMAGREVKITADHLEYKIKQAPHHMRDEHRKALEPMLKEEHKEAYYKKREKENG